MSESGEQHKAGRPPRKGFGVVRPRQQAQVGAVSKPAAAAAGGAATVHQVPLSGPGDGHNLTVSTDNGTILYRAQLRLIFWGKEWARPSAPVKMADVVADVQSIVAGPYLLGLEQYGVSRVWVDRVVDLSEEDPPNNPFDKGGITRGDHEDLVARLIDNGTVPEPEDDAPSALYAVFLPSTVGGVALGLPGDTIGEHTKFLDVDWDDITDADVYVAWVGNDGTRDTVSSTFSHELVEAVTDPDGEGWQIDPSSDFNWNEICDVCASAYRLNGVLVSSYWSQSMNACVVPDQSFTRFQVTWIWRPDHIEWLGGVDQDGNAWQLPRQAVMDRIRGGYPFFVHGATTGADALVGIYYLDATHPYLATYGDGRADDNLLALPQHPPT
ncbi:MAG: hypothetical protein ACRDVG_03860 [Jatrophihabitantaceae bacterium]